ncbi:MAG: patatin-like phospholipase family protein [Proteobacteria bacterium]|nr:patatin-like phospholipase family protein [Pseudomonadota bacterium]
MPEKLLFYAGEKALAQIREKGLTPDMIKVIAGAAGGPKWIVLYGLDQFIFSSWMVKRSDPLYLIGSSIGAFRFAAAMGNTPEESIDKLLDAYIHQAYADKPSPLEITEKSRDIIHHYLGDSGVEQVLSHPFMRLNFLTDRCKGLTAHDNKMIQALGFLPALMGNLLSRKNLGLFFERTLFFDSRDKAPFHTMNSLPTRQVPISRENLVQGILASGAIPLIMAGIHDIPGAGHGTFRDGGLVDYHLDIPYGVNGDIVLFPHYTDRVTPGWLDKSLSFRKPRKEHMDHVLMICPSRSFIRDLPYAKIPDRNDFMAFKGNDDGRFAYWQTVADKSRHLADDFSKAVETGTIKQRVRAFPF